jgi:hypothetical protein
MSPVASSDGNGASDIVAPLARAAVRRPALAAVAT